jgi:Flp pilus assembly protein TadD
MANRIEKDLRRLPDEPRWCLQRADGYMDLRMWTHAQRELSAVAAEHHDSFAFTHCRLRLAIEEKDWQASAQLARALHGQAPDEPETWIELAYVARRAEGVDAARQILSRALHRFPSLAIIPFNLACYECQLGDMKQARMYLARAFELEPGYRRLAVEDRDLEPLWPELED